jgi:hypothetical protein
MTRKHLNDDDVLSQQFNRSLDRYLLWVTALFLVAVAFAIAMPSWLQSTWPYLLMIGGFLVIAILASIDAGIKLIVLVMLTVLVSMAGALLLFYYTIPEHYGYVPLTDQFTGDQHLTIYQLQKKIQLFYTPDFPVQGDIISGYLSVCSNDYSECADIYSYELNATFVDDAGTQHIALGTQRFTNHTPFKIEYAGYPIDMMMRWRNNTIEFRLPKPSWSQTIQVDIKRHPWLGGMLIASSLLSIFSVFSIANIKNVGKKVTKAYAKRIAETFRRQKQNANPQKKKTNKTQR